VSFDHQGLPFRRSTSGPPERNTYSD
jgi:hypothetical protein